MTTARPSRTMRMIRNAGARLRRRRRSSRLPRRRPPASPPASLPPPVQRVDLSYLFSSFSHVRRLARAKHAHMRGEQPPPNVGFAAGGFIAPTLFAFCIICTGEAVSFVAEVLHFPKNHDMIFSTSAMGKCLITNRVICLGHNDLNIDGGRYIMQKLEKQYHIHCAEGDVGSPSCSTMRTLFLRTVSTPSIPVRCWGRRSPSAPPVSAGPPPPSPWRSCTTSALTRLSA